jgi:ABC-2 type transport system permease protein
VSSIRFLWIGVRKDASSIRRDPFGLLIPIGIPLVLAVLMNLVFGSSGDATPHGRLLVADEDQSIASNLLTGAFGRDPVNKMVTVEAVSVRDGRASMDRGKASGLLIVPKGLQDSFVRNAPFRLQFYTNPAERIVPRMIEETLAITLDGAFYAQKIAGPQLRALDTGAPPTDQALIAGSVAFRQLADKLVRYLRPPLIQLETTAVAGKPGLNFAALFFPCMIFMSLMMVANSLAAEIWKERVAGTLRRLAATPVSLMWYLAGRVLFVNFVLLCIGLVGVAAVHWMAGVPVASLPAAVLWVMFSGSALYLCLLILVMHADGPRTANIFGNMVIFPLAMLGGCFFPFEAMPDWMASIGKLTPNGLALTQFKAILGGSAPSGALAISAAGLIAVSAIAFLLAARRLRGGFVL